MASTWQGVCWTTGNIAAGSLKTRINGENSSDFDGYVVGILVHPYQALAGLETGSVDGSYGASTINGTILAGHHCSGADLSAAARAPGSSCVSIGWSGNFTPYEVSTGERVAAYYTSGSLRVYDYDPWGGALAKEYHKSGDYIYDNSVTTYRNEGAHGLGLRTTVWTEDPSTSSASSDSSDSSSSSSSSSSFSSASSTSSTSSASSASSQDSSASSSSSSSHSSSSSSSSRSSLASSSSSSESSSSSSSSGSSSSSSSSSASSESSKGNTVTAYPMLRRWGTPPGDWDVDEGAKTRTNGDTGEVTWLAAKRAVDSWSVVGADRNQSGIDGTEEWHYNIGLDRGDTAIAEEDVSGTGAVTLEFNATGVSALNAQAKNELCRLGFRLNWDVEYDGNDYVAFATSEYPATLYRPYLEIEFWEGSSSSSSNSSSSYSSSSSSSSSHSSSSSSSSSESSSSSSSGSSSSSSSHSSSSSSSHSSSSSSSSSESSSSSSSSRSSKLSSSSSSESSSSSSHSSSSSSDSSTSSSSSSSSFSSESSYSSSSSSSTFSSSSSSLSSSSSSISSSASSRSSEWADLESPTDAIPRRYEISPLRDHSFEAVEDHVVELHDVLVSLTQDINKLSGLDNQTPKIYNDMDFNSKRATNLKDPVDDQDAVTLSYFRRWLDRYISQGFKPGDRL